MPELRRCAPCCRPTAFFNGLLGAGGPEGAAAEQFAAGKRDRFLFGGKGAGTGPFLPPRSQVEWGRFLRLL